MQLKVQVLEKEKECKRVSDVYEDSVGQQRVEGGDKERKEGGRESGEMREYRKLISTKAASRSKRMSKHKGPGL